MLQNFFEFLDIYFHFALDLLVLLYVTCVYHFFQYTAACAPSANHRKPKVHPKDLEGGGWRLRESLMAGENGDSE